MYDTLLGVAVNRGTIQSICQDWLGIAEPETIRGYLNSQLRVEDLPELERRLNAALTDQTPPRIKRQPQNVAADLHDRPYYGKQLQDEARWVRGEARDGTTHFYRVATAYVMLNGLRVTLALHFVMPADDMVMVLRTLLNRLRCRAIAIACPTRGKAGGTRALCVGNKGYRTAYTFESAEQGAFTAELAVCRTFTTASPTKRLKRRVEWLIFILIQLELTPRQARRCYRRRFGIESSYRCVGLARGWTTSPNAAYRFVLLALSFILLNIWIRLRWLFTQVPRRGRRWLDTKCFQLGRFLNFIRRALERLYGALSDMTATVAPRA